jgi:hypothetical protein
VPPDLLTSVRTALELDLCFRCSADVRAASARSCALTKGALGQYEGREGESAAVPAEAFAQASRFREDLFDCLTARADELFDLTEALLCADGPVTSPVDLTLVAEHRRGHGAMYGALNCGNVDVPRLRQVLAGLPMPQAADGRLVLAVDVSNWLRPDAPTSADRLFCHVYGRSGRSSDQFIPGWPYSFVAALESGRTSWCQLLDAVRLGPEDDDEGAPPPSSAVWSRT